jgi:imidazoleglycerol-phosphate dehydratase
LIYTMRISVVERKTRETQIKLELNIDGTGIFKGTCGIGFFDHMLSLFCRHGMFDIDLAMRGDLSVDGHHSIEDLGLALGQALENTLGRKQGISRYGTFFVPMDEALVMVSLDLSGRPFLHYDVPVTCEKVGEFETELLPEFLRAFAANSGLTLHVKKINGTNNHHVIEALFKALGRALRQAVAPDPRDKGIPSTKGVL